MTYGEILEQQDALSSKAMKILWGRFDKLDITIPNSRNTQYGTPDVLRMVLQMSENENFARSATKDLKRKSYRDKQKTGSGARVPSADWALGKLGDVDPAKMNKWCEGAIAFMSRRALRAHTISKRTMVGLDITTIGYYGKKLRPEMYKTMPKNGTAYFDAYMTAHSIGPGYEIPLSNTRLKQGDKMDIILYENIKKIKRAGIRPSLYLLDRGFFSVACMLVIVRSGGDYIMPVPKNPRIIERMEQRHRGKIPAATRYTMENDEFGSVSSNLLIVKKDGCKESDPVAEQYVAFATSLPCRTREDLVKTIPETYRQRWIEETAFRVIKDVKGKTCSNKLHVRVFLFYFALLLYCLWKCTKYEDMLQEYLAGGDDFTIAEFTESVGHSAKNIMMWEKTHGNFLGN